MVERAKAAESRSSRPAATKRSDLAESSLRGPSGVKRRPSFDGLSRQSSVGLRRPPWIASLRCRFRGSPLCAPVFSVTLYSTPIRFHYSPPSSIHEHPMARIARFVVPGLPHHVTQRGNRRERYLRGRRLRALSRSPGEPVPASAGRLLGLLPDAEPRAPRAVPDREEALGGARRDTSAIYIVINARLRVTGHLFQSRFGSAVMDEEHLLAATLHVALNPVRAGPPGGPRTGDGRASGPIARSGTTRWSASPLIDRARPFADLLDAPVSAEAVLRHWAAESMAARSAPPPCRSPRRQRQAAIHEPRAARAKPEGRNGGWLITVTSEN